MDMSSQGELCVGPKDEAATMRLFIDGHLSQAPSRRPPPYIALAETKIGARYHPGRFRRETESIGDGNSPNP